jgi:hypothetical protein
MATCPRAISVALDGAVFALWMSLFLFLAARHVSWRDEYQSWLVATRTHTLAEFLRAVNYERSPPLQYVLQRGFYELCRGLKLFLPLPDFSHPVYFRAVTYAFSIGTAALLSFGFGLPRKLKWLLPFHFIFLFDWGIVSRSYSLGAFFILASVWCFQRRKIGGSCLALGLAGLTHFYFTLLAAGMLLVQTWRLFPSWRSLQTRKLTAHGLPIAFAGAAILLSVWLQLPPKDSLFPTALDLHLHPLSFGVRNLVHGLTLLDGFQGPFQFEQPLLDVGSAWVFLGALAIAGWWERFPLLDFAILAAVPFLLVSSLAGAATRYLAIFFLAALAAFLLRRSASANRRRTGVGVMTVIALFGVYTTCRWLRSWKPYLDSPAYDWSGSLDLHEKMGSELADPRALIVTDTDWLFFPTMVLENKSVFDVRRNAMLHYPDFRLGVYTRSFDEWCRDPVGYSKLSSAGFKLYFGTTASSEPPASCGTMKRVFQTTRPVHTDESYAIYVRE